MSETAVAVALSASISVLGLIGAAALLRAYLIDSFRDQLFALRDDMFLYACDEGLLDSIAHRHLRRFMNGMIRYAHRTSIARLMVLDVARRLFGLPLKLPTAYLDWARAISELSEPQARKFVEFHDRAILLAMKHMMQRSPALWVGTALLGSYFLIWRSTMIAVDRAANVMRRRVLPADLFESEAYNA